MIKAMSFAAAGFLLAATGAAAAEPEDGKTEAAAAEKEKKICRSEKMTGSLTRVRRTCLTASQWAELAENTNRTLDRVGRSANQAEGMTNRSFSGPGGGS